MADKIEPATSARAKCRACKATIAKGELRFGEVVGNAYSGDDDEMTLWYHLACAANKRPAKLTPALAKYKGSVPDRAALIAKMKTTGKTTKLEKIRYAERSPTARAKCQHCRKVIARSALRLAITIDTDPTMPGLGFIHATCGRAFAGDGVGRWVATRTKKLTPNDVKELNKLLK